MNVTENDDRIPGVVLDNETQGVRKLRADQGKILIGRLPHGSDLLGSLTTVCLDENVQFGRLSVIGAVSSGTLGFYRQDEREYMDCFNLEKGLEIVSCKGNVSIKDGEVFVHAHGPS